MRINTKYGCYIVLKLTSIYSQKLSCQKRSKAELLSEVSMCLNAILAVLLKAQVAARHDEKLLSLE